MTKRRKIWTSMTTAAMVSTIALTAAQQSSAATDKMKDSLEEPSFDQENAVQRFDVAWFGEGEGEGKSGEGEGEGGEGEGEGEGEGGEGEGEGEGGGEGEGEGAGVDPALLSTDDVAYLSQLSLMRGHLLVGLELYRAGAFDHAKTHMKHPSAELYADVVDAFDARGSSGFADELEALAAAVEKDQEATVVEAAYSALTSAISDAEGKVSEETKANVGENLKVVVSLIKTAADEYAIGVVDGKLANAHEYQDAYGFTQVAKSIVSDLQKNAAPSESETLSNVASALDELDPAWPNVMPPETLETDAQLLYGIAARIEFAIASLN